MLPGRCAIHTFGPTTNTPCNNPYQDSERSDSFAIHYRLRGAPVTSTNPDLYGSSTTTPLWPVVFSVIAVVTSITLAFLTWDSPKSVSLNIVGWFVATWLAETSLIAYRHLDRKRRGKRNYVMARSRDSTISKLTIVGIAVGLYHGWRVAEWWAT